MEVRPGFGGGYGTECIPIVRGPHVAVRKKKKTPQLVRLKSTFF